VQDATDEETSGVDMFPGQVLRIPDAQYWPDAHGAQAVPLGPAYPGRHPHCEMLYDPTEELELLGHCKDVFW
jgi:hypothetical protein